MDVSYSMTEPGYRAWLDDGNEGTFEDFLQDQAKLSNKEHLIETIVGEFRRDEPGGAKRTSGGHPR